MPVTNSELLRSTPRKRVSASLNAQNLFTTATSGATQASSGTAGVPVYGKYAVRVRNTWSGTLSFQRSTDDGVTWDDITTGTGAPTAVTLTANGIVVLEEVARGAIVRVGFKTAAYTSGTADVEIQQ